MPLTIEEKISLLLSEIKTDTEDNKVKLEEFIKKQNFVLQELVAVQNHIIRLMEIISSSVDAKQKNQLSKLIKDMVTKPDSPSKTN